MQWDCGRRKRLREGEARRELQRILEWHRVFLWKPTKIAYNDCRWLEVIERKWVVYDPLPLRRYGYWVYRSVRT